MVHDDRRVVADPLALEEQPVDELDFLSAVQPCSTVPEGGWEPAELLEDAAPERHAGPHDSARDQERVLQHASLVFFGQGQPRQQAATARQPTRHFGFPQGEHLSPSTVEIAGRDRAQHPGHPVGFRENIIVGVQDDGALRHLDAHIPGEALSLPRLELVANRQAACLAEATYDLSRLIPGVVVDDDDFPSECSWNLLGAEGTEGVGEETRPIVRRDDYRAIHFASSGARPFRARWESAGGAEALRQSYK